MQENPKIDESIQKVIDNAIEKGIIEKPSEEQKPGDEQKPPVNQEQKPGDEQKPPVNQEQKPSEEQKPGDEQKPPVNQEQEPSEEQKPGDEQKPFHEQISDDAFLQAYNARTGKNLKSISELEVIDNSDSNNEESEEKFIERKNKLNQWALDNNLVTQDLINKFESDSKLPKTELLFIMYKSEREGEINPDTDLKYTESELREEFEDEHYLYQEDDSNQKKRSLKLLDLKYKKYFEDNYSPLLSLEDSYENSLEIGKSKNKINPIFQNVISKFSTESIERTIKDELGNDFIIKIPIDPKKIEAINVGSINGLSLTDDENENVSMIRNKIENIYIQGNLDKVLKEFATAYHSAKLVSLGAKNIGIEHRHSTLPNTVNQGNEIPESIQKVLNSPVAKQILSN